MTMLHTLRKKPATEGDGERLVDLLLACHGRIRTFLDLAVAIGQRADATDADVIDASARVQRYFSQALPLHVEDEELGVLPRLHGRSPELDAALDRMCDEHDLHGPLLRQLLTLSAHLVTTPADADSRRELARVAGELRAELEPHLQAEEAIVFAAIGDLLTEDEQRVIVGELRARRHPT